MKIQYISNTCDLDGIDECGEIMLVFKDGQIVHHHDYSDGALETDYVEALMKSLGVEIEFESIKPDKKQLKSIKTYLKEHGY